MKHMAMAMDESTNKTETKTNNEGLEFDGCKHYKRNCQLKAPCCGKLYTCRFCHNDVENHELDRQKVKQVKCMSCENIQMSAKDCTSCGKSLANYYCNICNFFDNVDRKQFHCVECGICRIGGRDNFFHCKICDVCLSNDIRDTHKCSESVSRRNCPVCLEDLHTSTSPNQVLECSHLLHKKCFKDMLKNGNFACPLCCKVMIEMEEYWRELDAEIAVTPMPKEYANMKVHILCRDCHKEGEVLFHVLGLKCLSCNSYNTCRSDGSTTS